MAGDSSPVYKPGDLIYESKPYVKVIRRDLWDTVCSWCMESPDDLKFCAACKMIKYCGKPCQKAAWKDHKLECPYLPRYTAGPHHFTVQMVGKLILKTKGKNWESITDEVMGEKVSFADLKYQNFQLMKLPWSRMVFNEIKNSLKSYLGQVNLPDEETLLRLIGKVECNHYSFGDNITSWALFIGPSKFDHSCIPNTNVYYDGAKVQIRAIKNILETEKVTFSFCAMFCLFDAPVFYANLKNSFGEGGCKCIECSKPYGQSPLTNILDPVLAVPILEETEGTLLMASMMNRYKYPLDYVTQAKLRQLLKRQEGVLGNTHLARIRLLALKCLLLNGNIFEMKQDLMTLESWVKLVWGDNFEELTEIYEKLIRIFALLFDPVSIRIYKEKLIRLKTICMGNEEDALDSIKNLFI